MEYKNEIITAVGILVAIIGILMPSPYLLKKSSRPYQRRARRMIAKRMMRRLRMRLALMRLTRIWTSSSHSGKRWGGD